MSVSSSSVFSPVAAAVVSVDVEPGQLVEPGQIVATVESMKLQTAVPAPAGGKVTAIHVRPGQTVQKHMPLLDIEPMVDAPPEVSANTSPAAGNLDALNELRSRQALTLDESRTEAVTRRHAKGYRTARENLADLVDDSSFIEYGQLAVAAQRNRRELDDLRRNTPADGVITGLATINAGEFGKQDAAVAVIINDYTVLAGTQGFFHHMKLDRIIEVARRQQLPVVMYTEGGGGRPGDTDVDLGSGLDVTSFVAWARLCNEVPTIAVNNGYCFAGNAALFGCADVRIATRSSWIGMAGPAMIEGGGLGVFKPTEIGPAEEQAGVAVVDLLADDEAQATELAQQVLAYTQGSLREWQCADQSSLRTSMPADRRFAYDVRSIINTLVDRSSFTELTRDFGGAIITGFIRIEGLPMGLLANDCRVLGGAIDCDASDKAARFIQMCQRFGLPLLSLCDTPGFMVGPDSEAQGAARRMGNLFRTGAALTVPMVCVILRKAYGLGAMAMAGGGFDVPAYTVAWPTGETGPMGLEGAARLGFKRELEAESDPAAREALFNQIVDSLYEKGKATESAAMTELDGVIDPADTRQHVLRALAAL